MRFLYSLLWYLLLPFLLLRLWWRGRLAPAYRARWAERLALGYAARGIPRLDRCVWIHAVSVGEFLAAKPIIDALLQAHADMPLLVTTTTPTGSERVIATFGQRVVHVYCPWELPGAWRRFLRYFNPELCLVMETELWPNFTHLAKQQGCRLMLVNGRLSDRSCRGYGRLSALVRPMLEKFDLLSVQTENDAKNFLALGARPEQVRVNGSVKFDLDISAALRASAMAEKQRLGTRPVWIAASTHPQEEALVLAAHQRVLAQLPQALLVWVPRHPERFDAVASLATTAGLSVARRSQQEDVTASVQVYLGDTMGELLLLYGVAEVALVAGSLAAPLGGHNLLEPAAWEMPVISGSHLENFQAIAELMQQAGALTVVHAVDELSTWIIRLLQDEHLRKQQGQKAYRLLAANQGALARLLTQVEALWPKGLH